MRNKRVLGNTFRGAGIPALCLIALLLMMTLSSCSLLSKTDEADNKADCFTETEGSAEAADMAAEGSHGIKDSITEPPSRPENGSGVRAYDPGDRSGNGEPNVLTGGCWRDHDNWPFFINLVNSGTISFPSFGLDPRHRIKVTVTDESGSPLRGETLELKDAEGSLIWTAKSGKDGTAYLFYIADDAPAYVTCCGEEIDVSGEVQETFEDGQGGAAAGARADYTMTVIPEAPDRNGVQIMFIIDTTGSMSDELAFLQKDFSAIAEEVGGSDVYFSTGFYRDEGDEYVTKCNGFTQDVQTVVSQLGAEYAEGGGDNPEAVAEILEETMNNSEWREDCSKIAFLIFDAPPHIQREASIVKSIKTAAEQGIVIVPVVASNAERDTELFARAAAILTGGTYGFLTDDSGVGESHLEPIIGDYQVELLHDIIVKVIDEYR